MYEAINRLRVRLNKVQAVVAKGLSLVDDQTASIAPGLYGKMQYDGSLVKAGTRINWNGALKRANNDLWAYPENNPDNAPALWADIAYKQGYRIAPDVFTSTNAAAMDECMWFGDVLYRSKMAGNTFTPETAPNVWEVVET